MPIKVSQKKTSLGDGLFLYKVYYGSPQPCEPHSIDGLTQRQELLKTVIDSPGLSFVGGGQFEEMRVFHNGTGWVVEITRKVQESGFSSES